MKATAQKAAVLMAQKNIKVQDLINNYPPEYTNSFKKAMYEKAVKIHKTEHGIVKISRWKFCDERKSPLKMEANPIKVSVVDNFFDYSDTDTETKNTFYLNYADPNLFGYYDGDLFAQDEIQTFEHPLLASVLEYIDKNETPELISRTIEKGSPTPFIVENVPYWIKVDMLPVIKDEDGKDCVCSIYGWNFSHAPKEALEKGISVIHKEQKNNIIAVAALGGGRGTYTENQIAYTLSSLLVSFGAAAKITTREKKNEVVIHTGRWGCGAFGNNDEFIYLTQIIAASFTGVTELVFHGCDEEILKKAWKKFEGWDKDHPMDFLLKQNYTWKNGDGK